METLTIRRAHRSDVRALMDIGAEHAAYERLVHDIDARADALADALEGSPPQLWAWLAHVGEELVGYASATVDFSTLDRATYLHMDTLYVRERWRGRAVGTALWQVVRHHAATLGCAAMQWQTPAWNVDAARFYRRLGALESAKLRYQLPLCGA